MTFLVPYSIWNSRSLVGWSVSMSVCMSPPLSQHSVDTRGRGTYWLTDGHTDWLTDQPTRLREFHMLYGTKNVIYISWPHVICLLTSPVDRPLLTLLLPSILWTEAWREERRCWNIPGLKQDNYLYQPSIPPLPTSKKMGEMSFWGKCLLARNGFGGNVPVS